MGKANLPYFGWVGTLVGKANVSGQGKFALFGLGWNFSGQGFRVVFSNVMGFPGGWVLCLYPRYH